MRHADLVSALRLPSFWDSSVERVEHLQTHISSIFLTGKRAYKLKKPVNFGFLDFSTLALRERYCRAEVELNRRLAPDTYLGVAPITCHNGELELGSDGTPEHQVVDWLVVMRQLDGELLGTEVAARGELAERHIDQLIARLEPFYREARTGPGVDQFGRLEVIQYNTDENFTQTEDQVGKTITRQRFEHIRGWTRAFYREREELFESRVRSGRIREGHGDLHLGNVFFEDPPVIFDCVEFNERLRCCDVAADLAFLAMDLDFRNRPELSRYLVDRFVAASGDAGLVDLLDFYRCYRAYVRAKVHCLTSVDPGLGGSGRRAHRNLARHYFGLAYRYAGGTERPPLIVVYGLMGTGKTQIARHLRERWGWHLLSTDAVRKQISGVGEQTRVYVPYETGLYSPEMSRRTYEEVCNRAENLLHAGFPVVVDGSFKTRADRLPVVELAARAGAKPLFLEVTCAPEEQRRRLESRQQHDTRSDGRVELMETQRTEWEPPEPGDPKIFERISTDGTRAATHARVTELLERRGMLGGSDATQRAAG